MPSDRESPSDLPQRKPTARPLLGRWLVAGIAAGLLLFWAFRGLDLAGIARVLRRVDLGWLAVALGLDLLIIGNRSLKWRCLLPDGHAVRQADVFAGTAIGIMLNSVLPIRLDELFRSVFLSRKTGLHAATVFGTIVLERIWDGTVLLAVLGSLAALVTLPAALSLAGAVAATVVASLLGVVLLALKAAPLASGRFRVLGAFRQGLAVPRRPRAWLAPPLLCAFEWIASVFFLLSIGWSLGIQLTPLLALLVHGAHTLSFAFALLPGGLGLLESLDRLVLTTWSNVGPSEMFSFVILCRVMLSVPATVLGLALLYREGLSLAGVRKAVATRSDVDSEVVS